MSSIRIIPLGGLGEIGMNCLALEQRGEVLVVDCGVTFDGRGLGVDVVHPDFEALDEYRVVGLFVTHGHEDHIGAIPYFLRRFDVPVLGPRYALNLVRERAADHEILDHVHLQEVTPRSRVRVGSFEVEPIRVTHSIADATALAIRTDGGLVVHTGDFKFDDTPPDGETFDVERFQELAREGVRLLLSDSTNVDASGPTGSEQGVGRALDEIVGRAEQAVVVAMFASNVHRLRMLGEIARRHDRKVVALGQSVSTHARVARATARATGEHAGRPYLEWPSDLVWPADRARELPRRAVLGVATGTQGEPEAALARLARGEHAAFELCTGDVVAMSSRAIPGNEPAVMHLMNDLLRRGVELRTWWSDRALHVSGHAHRDEQRRMIELALPRAFVPVHGTLHHLLRHAALARELGVPEVCVLENGDVAVLDSDGVRHSARVRTGRVHVAARRVLPSSVLRDRAALASHGTAHVCVPVDARGRLAGEIALVTRGVVDHALDGRVLASARTEVLASVEALLGDVEAAADGTSPAPPGGGQSLAPERDGEIAEVAGQAVRRALGRVLGFKPIATVTVLRVQR
jgi:ribonuclease J